MNRKWWEQTLAQYTALWQNFNLVQRGSIVVASLLLVGFFLYLIFAPPKQDLSPIFLSEEMLSPADIAEIKTLLDQDGIPYKAQGRTLFVPKDKVQKVRLDLVASGYPKNSQEKGFELFDSNTWIRGEKELQVLELRALKGQLEKDITQFDNIRSANVILDIAPPRPFGGSMYKTKASVILNLIPGARISASELRAITFHVTGAVRGLTPNMVAISDTSGKLYQPIDPEGNTDLIRNSEMALEEQLKAKIDAMLALIVGLDNYYSSVQVVMNREKTSEERKVYSGTVEGVNLGSPVTTQISESTRIPSEVGGHLTQALSPLNIFQQTKQQMVPLDLLKIDSSPGKIENISAAVLVDKQAMSRHALYSSSIAGKDSTEHLRQQIQEQINTILKGYTDHTLSTVNVTEFDPSRLALHQTVNTAVTVNETKNWNSVTVTVVILAILVVLAILRFVLIESATNSSQQTNHNPNNERKLNREKDNIKAENKNKPEGAPPKSTQSNPWIKGNVSKENDLLQLLMTTDLQALSEVLIKEKPLTTAFLLSFLPSQRISDLLIQMPIDNQASIISSLAKLTQMPPKLIEEAENALSERWGNLPKTRGKREENDFSQVVEIVTLMPMESKHKLLEQLIELDHPLATHLHEALLSIHDDLETKTDN